MFKALIPLWLAFGSVLSGCPFKSDKEERKEVSIRHIGDLTDIPESSGLVYLNDSTVYTHSDSGNPPIIFQFSATDFQTTKEIELEVPNVDWEEMSDDASGNIYVGDFGNNSNARKDLKIYQFDPQFQLVKTIDFNYPDQKYFPPKNKKSWNFDCEAFFWLRGHLYLFSKSMTEDYTKIYRLNPATSKILLMDSLELKAPITAADIRSDGKEAVLLSYSKLFFVDVSEESTPAFTPSLCVKFAKSGQSEAIAYKNDQEVLITNEKGKVFLLKR